MSDGIYCEAGRRGNAELTTVTLQDVRTGSMQRAQAVKALRAATGEGLKEAFDAYNTVAMGEEMDVEVRLLALDGLEAAGWTLDRNAPVSLRIPVEHFPDFVAVCRFYLAGADIGGEDVQRRRALCKQWIEQADES